MGPKPCKKVAGPPDQVVSSDMENFDDEDYLLVDFVESIMLSGPEEQEETREAMRPSKRARNKGNSSHQVRRNQVPPPLPPAARILSGVFTNIPPEIIHNILKFLSSEDLISCSIACKFFCCAASDDSLWRRLYCMRWGLARPSSRLRASTWKNLYMQRDREDMSAFVSNTSSELKEYYIQMQAAMRSQAPLPSQVNDHHIILDTMDHVSIWRSSRGFTDESVKGHICSGNTCTYSRIGDVYLCEKTGRVHVCDHTCCEDVWDQSCGEMVCTISGFCRDKLIFPEEEADNVGLTDEMESSMGPFAQIGLLGTTIIMTKNWKQHLGLAPISRALTIILDGA